MVNVFTGFGKIKAKKEVIIISCFDEIESKTND